MSQVVVAVIGGGGYGGGGAKICGRGQCVCAFVYVNVCVC